MIEAREINGKTTTSMAENDEMIIATSDIAIAIKKDGSSIVDKSITPEVLTELYKVLTDYVQKCDEKDFLAFALVDMVCGLILHTTIKGRAEKIERSI